MKLFYVVVERTHELESYVMGRNKEEAIANVMKGIENSELEFDPDGNKPEITSIQELDISEVNLRDVKNYGILNEDAELVYDLFTVEELEKRIKKAEKEEYLKKNHMEFKFDKEV